MEWCWYELYEYFPIDVLELVEYCTPVEVIFWGAF